MNNTLTPLEREIFDVWENIGYSMQENAKEPIASAIPTVLIRQIKTASEEEKNCFLEVFGGLIFSELLLNELIFFAANTASIDCRPLIICNDIFYWGCADLEPFSYNDLVDIYYYWRTVPEEYGLVVWASLHRKLQPQLPLIEDMKKAGAWIPELDLLTKPEPS